MKCKVVKPTVKIELEIDANEFAILYQITNDANAVAQALA